MTQTQNSSWILQKYVDYPVTSNWPAALREREKCILSQAQLLNIDTGARLLVSPNNWPGKGSSGNSGEYELWHYMPPSEPTLLKVPEEIAKFTDKTDSEEAYNHIVDLAVKLTSALALT